MATIRRTLSTRIDSAGCSEILLRLSVSRALVMRIKSGIFIDPKRFRDQSVVVPRNDTDEAARLRRLEDRLISEERFLIKLCETNAPAMLSKDYIMRELYNFRFSNVFTLEPQGKGFFSIFDDFIDARDISAWRRKHLQVLKRALMRFEQYVRLTDNPAFRIGLHTFRLDDLRDFEMFLRSEHLFYPRFPQIYDNLPADGYSLRKKPRPEPKGSNTIIALFAMFRSFYRWCRTTELTTNNPFLRYGGKTSGNYGTPYYLTIDERDTIAGFDLSAQPFLAVQRDIFIFQCLIGCRVSDLLTLKHTSVIDGAVEYVPHKTRTERPQVVRVPLNKRAMDIVRAYASRSADDRLLPFISPQKYNRAIKSILSCCGITRMVTVLNPLTGEEEKRPINELASSHLARRTFIGNLYKKVKDPNLVGALSGHKEGSKAFARYRVIDDDIKRELVSLID